MASYKKLEEGKNKIKKISEKAAGHTIVESMLKAMGEFLKECS